MKALKIAVALLMVLATLSTVALADDADRVAVIVKTEKDGADMLHTAVDTNGDVWEFWADAEEYFTGDIVYLTIWAEGMEIVGVDTVGHLNPREMVAWFTK